MALTVPARSKLSTARVSRSCRPLALLPGLTWTTSIPSTYAASRALGMSSERALVTSPGKTL
jgi:hypothetical protein